MQTNRVNWEKEITKEDLLEILSGANRPLFTSRQLTKLCSEGLLPSLQRRSRLGSKSPVNVWDKSVIEQASFLYDLLQWNRAHEWVQLPLWLRGYPVDFAPIRQRWLQSIDANLQILTQGEAADPQDIINDFVVDRLVRKWKHTPTKYRPKPLKNYEYYEKYEEWIEMFLNMLLVKDYELDEMIAEVFEKKLLQQMQILQEILALPQLRKIVEQATSEAWEQARLDYMTFCQFLQTLFAPLGQVDMEGLDLWFFATGGSLLVPVVLALRQQGYGYWIDDAFVWARNYFADPDTQTWLEHMADPTIQILLTTPEGRAQFTEQFPRLRAEWLRYES